MIKNPGGVWSTRGWGSYLPNPDDLDKFKVGEEIVCIKRGKSNLTIGKIYTVQEKEPWQHGIIVIDDKGKKKKTIEKKFMSRKEYHEKTFGNKMDDLLK